MLRPIRGAEAGKRALSDRLRLLLHLPVGLVNALLFSICEPAGVCFSVGFLLYEVAQDLHHRDRCYADVAGWLWGLAVALIAWWALAALRCRSLFTC